MCIISGDYIPYKLIHLQLPSVLMKSVIMDKLSKLLVTVPHTHYHSQVHVTNEWNFH